MTRRLLEELDASLQLRQAISHAQGDSDELDPGGAERLLTLREAVGRTCPSLALVAKVALGALPERTRLT